MKKLFALMTAAVLALALSACQSPQPAEVEADNTDDQEKLELTHPGEYLNDYIDTLSIGDREIPLSITFEEARELFGDDFKTSYPDILEEVVPNKFIGLYSSYADIIDNGSYWGMLTFGSEKESGEDAFLIMFRPLTDFGGDSMNVTWSENGEYFDDDFPFEFGKITSSIGGFTTGISTRSQIREFFGDGRADDSEEDDLYFDTYMFEDYGVEFQYNENGIIIRFVVILHE